jgi:glycosyltransferase involved in cell wall biosynthesis
MPAEDVREMRPDFDITVHTPISENCGGVVEPLLAGVPTIAGRIGGLPEAVIDGISGKLVAIRRPQELASAVLDVLDKEEHYRRLARVGRELARTMFDIRRTSKEIYEIYRHILDRDHPSPPAFDSLSYARTWGQAVPIEAR